MRKKTCWAALEENTTHPGISSPEPSLGSKEEKAGARGRVARRQDGAGGGAGVPRDRASPAAAALMSGTLSPGRNAEALTGLKEEEHSGVRLPL